MGLLASHKRERKVRKEGFESWREDRRAKKDGMNIKGGTDFVQPRSVRGGKRSKNTLSNVWPPSPHVHFYTLRLRRHIKINCLLYLPHFLPHFTFLYPVGE